MSASEIYTNDDDQAAFADVYRAHHGKLLRYCQYRLRDRHEAEDVAQEAFARAWRSMPGSAFDRNFYPWLRVVASNLCTDVQRKRNRSEPVASLEIPGYDPDVERLVEDADRVLLRQALDRLNERHRSALIMREGEGLTYDQIAERTGVTSGTVESLLWRARQSLKREFTVLAGGEGALAVIPFLVVLVRRARSSGRRAMARVAGVVGQGENPLAHAAIATVAALTVATGVIATLGMGSSSGASPAVVVHQSRAAAVAGPSSRSGVPSAATVAPAKVAQGVPTRASVPSHTVPVPRATAGGGGSRSGLHYTNLIGPTGHNAAVAAKAQHVVVNVPNVVVVGINPQMIPAYAAGVLKKSGL